MSKSWKDHSNLSMLTDFYELTMSKGYFDHGMKDTIAYFDLFFGRFHKAAVLRSRPVWIK